MDTIIRENPHLHVLEHAVLPTAAPKLSFYQRFVTKMSLKLEDMIMVFVCCTPSNMVEDWEFDESVRQSVVAMQDDDVDFSDIVEQFNIASLVEQTERDAAHLATMGDIVADESSWVNTTGPVQSTGHMHQAVLPSDDDNRETALALLENRAKLKVRVRARRRRKRVVAYVVVALINKVRCKYYHMDDNPANHRLVGSYLLKLMREHNFRTCDIHLHVDYAVRLYFETQSQSMKPAAYARA